MASSERSSDERRLEKRQAVDRLRKSIATKVLQLGPVFAPFYWRHLYDYSMDGCRLMWFHFRYIKAV